MLTKQLIRVFTLEHVFCARATLSYSALNPTIWGERWGLSRQWNAVLKCTAASLHCSGSIQSVVLILLIMESSRVHNGVGYTHVSVINNMYLEEIDLVLATT